MTRLIPNWLRNETVDFSFTDADYWQIEICQKPSVSSCVFFSRSWSCVPVFTVGLEGDVLIGQVEINTGITEGSLRLYTKPCIVQKAPKDAFDLRVMSALFSRCKSLNDSCSDFGTYFGRNRMAHLCGAYPRACFGFTRYSAFTGLSFSCGADFQPESWWLGFAFANSTCIGHLFRRPFFASVCCGGFCNGIRRWFSTFLGNAHSFTRFFGADLAAVSFCQVSLPFFGKRCSRFAQFGLTDFFARFGTTFLPKLFLSFLRYSSTSHHKAVLAVGLVFHMPILSNWSFGA